MTRHTFIPSAGAMRLNSSTGSLAVASRMILKMAFNQVETEVPFEHAVLLFGQRRGAHRTRSGRLRRTLCLCE